MKNKKHISILLSIVMMLSFTFSSNLTYADDVKTDDNFKITVTNVEGENYNHLSWTDLGKGYTYRVYQKGREEEVFQSIPTKKSVKTLNIYPEDSNITNTGKSEGQVDLDGKSVPDSGILKTWLLREKISDVAIDCVSLKSFNSNPSKYLKKEDGKWNYDSVFYGMWNLLPDTVYPNDNAVEYLRTFINDGGGFMTSHHTIGYRALDKGVNKLGKEMGVEIFSTQPYSISPPYAGKDANGNMYKTVSFEKIENTKPDTTPYWASGTQVKIVKNGLLINYPFKVGKVGDVIDIPYTHGLGLLGKGDVWMNVEKPTGFYNIDFKEINQSPTTGEKGTNNFYVHTYNNTAIINSGHSFPSITTAETRIIANTLYYLSQVTDKPCCEDHKGQDVTAPVKPNINKVNLDKASNRVNINIAEQGDVGTEYDYYVEAEAAVTGEKVKSDTKAATVTSGIKGYSIVVDQNENTVPKNEVTTTSTNYTVDNKFNSDFYVHVAAIDNANNISEVTSYKYVYPTLNLTAGDLNTDNNTVTIKAEANGTQSPIKSITLPDGKPVDGSNAEYTVDVNGTYTFKAVDNEGNEVTKEIEITNIPGNITLNDIKVNADNASTTLNWNNSDKTQNYSYNINSKKSDETEFTVAPVNGETYIDTNAKDVTAPDNIEIRNVSVNKDNKNTEISFTESIDKGTSYDYYVDATGENSGLNSKSAIKSASVTSGLKGYSVVVDQNKDTVPDGTITTTSTDYTFDKVYDSDFYVHVAAVDNAGNMSKVSTYKYSYPVLKLTPSTTAEVKDTVTITAEASCEGNSIVKIITPDGKEIAGDKAEYEVNANGTYTFTAVDGRGNPVPQSIDINNIKPDVILNVEPDKNKLRLKQDFTVDYYIDYVNNIGGVDSRIQFDNTKLEYEGIEEVPGMLCFSDKEDDGVIRFSCISYGSENFINSKKSLLKLKFKTISSGDAKIDVISGEISSEQHPERELRPAECGETTVKIYSMEYKTDFTLADVVMVGKHKGEDPEKLLPDIDVDLNLDGKIDDTDVKIAYDYMKNNPNYKYNK